MFVNLGSDHSPMMEAFAKRGKKDLPTIITCPDEVRNLLDRTKRTTADEEI